MQTQSTPVDWAALDEYLTRGADAPILNHSSLEAIATGRSRVAQAEIAVALPTVIEPELVRWAGLPF